jgi:hypothetical protein
VRAHQSVGATSRPQHRGHPPPSSPSWRHERRVERPDLLDSRCPAGNPPRGVVVRPARGWVRGALGRRRTIHECHLDPRSAVAAVRDVGPKAPVPPSGGMAGNADDITSGQPVPILLTYETLQGLRSLGSRRCSRAPRGEPEANRFR